MVQWLEILADECQVYHTNNSNSHSNKTLNIQSFSSTTFFYLDETDMPGC